MVVRGQWKDGVTSANVFLHDVAPGTFCAISACGAPTCASHRRNACLLLHRGKEKQPNASHGAAAVVTPPPPAVRGRHAPPVATKHNQRCCVRSALVGRPHAHLIAAALVCSCTGARRNNLTPHMAPLPWSLRLHPLCVAVMRLPSPRSTINAVVSDQRLWGAHVRLASPHRLLSPATGQGEAT